MNIKVQKYYNYATMTTMKIFEIFVPVTLVRHVNTLIIISCFMHSLECGMGIRDRIYYALMLLYITIKGSEFVCEVGQ